MHRINKTLRLVPFRMKSFRMHLILEYFYNGFLDSFQFPITFFVIYGSTTLLHKTALSTLLTIAIFTISTFTFYYIVGPMASLLSLSENRFIYNLFWIGPTYLLSGVINRTRYQDIATRSFQIFVGSPTRRKSTVTG